MSPRTLALALAGAALLAGCVTVLPPAPPAQLYRFGVDADGPATAAGPLVAAAPGGIGPALALTGVILPRAAAGDGLLAVTGDEAAYLARARWVSPAAVLMQEAAERAFSARPGGVRLLRRDEVGPAAAALSLDVRDFEVRYAAAGATPVVRVTVQATITRRDGVTAAERTFSVDQPAAENRLSAIVPAYDAATRQVLVEVAAWADGVVRGTRTSAAGGR